MIDIQALHRQGLSQQAISALTGHDRKTIRKYVKRRRLPAYGPRTTRPSKLDPFNACIEELLSQGVWNAVVMLEKLRTRGYTGGYTILKDYLQPRREAAHVQAVRRFETAAGEQAQVDWGELGTITLVDGAVRKLYLFEMVLGYSRAAFRAVVTDRKLATFLRLHEEAFRALGGVCRTLVYDRLKTVVLEVKENGEVVWQQDFARFAGYYGFAPRLCPAYRAQTKGKVESGIGYVKKNFLCGREAHSVADLDGQLRGWTGRSNRRVHGTTHRVVAEAWMEERPFLHSVEGLPPFALEEAESRLVARDAYIDWRSNRYSVPWPWAGDRVRVREVDAGVEIRHGEDAPARHALCLGRHQVITDPAHHRGIPLGPGGRPRRRIRLQLRERAPVVEQRALSAYAALLEVGP